MICSSCITCLAHPVIYKVVGQIDPFVYNLCNSVLQRLGNLTSDLHLNKYTYLYLLLWVCPFLHFFLKVIVLTGDYDRALG